MVQWESRGATSIILHPSMYVWSIFREKSCLLKIHKQVCLNSGQKDKWLKQQAALATDMLLISQGNVNNSRSKERGGRAHTLGDGLPGTISKQLALGMSGSCCKASKAIDQGVRQLGITWCGGWGREGRQTPCPPWWATAGNCHTTPRSSGWRGRRTSSCPSRGMSAVWWGLTCFWRWCIQLNSLQCNSECMCSLLCLWEIVCIF